MANLSDAALREAEKARSRHEWAVDRRAYRMSRSLLLRAIQREIDPIRRSDIATPIVHDVTKKVEEIAREQGLLQRVRGDLLQPDQEIVPPVYRRKILEELARSRSFLGWLRRQRRGALRSAHLVRVDPEDLLMRLSDHLVVSAPPATGTWKVESDIGLGAASCLENGPEGWFAWVAREVARFDEGDVDLDHVQGVNMLHLFAGPGSLARSVTALGARGQGIRIQERDALVPGATALPCVAGRNEDVSEGVFDAIVAVFPSPGVGGAANHRRVYSRDRRDISFLGTKRWRAEVRVALRGIAGLVELGTKAYLLLPLGVRQDEGYEEHPELLDGLLDGLPVNRLIETVEVNSVKQPFVGTYRPRYVTVILQPGARP